MSAVKRNEGDLKYAALFLLTGFLVGAGMKAADWMIPDPPRKPVEIHVTRDE